MAELNLLGALAPHLPQAFTLIIGGVVLGVYVRKLVMDAPRTSRAQNGAFRELQGLREDVRQVRGDVGLLREEQMELRSEVASLRPKPTRRRRTTK